MKMNVSQEFLLLFQRCVEFSADDLWISALLIYPLAAWICFLILLVCVHWWNTMSSELAKQKDKIMPCTKQLIFLLTVIQAPGFLLRRKRAQRKGKRKNPCLLSDFLLGVYWGTNEANFLIYWSTLSWNSVTIYLQGIIMKITLKCNRTTWLMEVWIDYQNK